MDGPFKNSRAHPKLSSLNNYIRADVKITQLLPDPVPNPELWCLGKSQLKLGRRRLPAWPNSEPICFGPIDVPWTSISSRNCTFSSHLPAGLSISDTDALDPDHRTADHFRKMPEIFIKDQLTRWRQTGMKGDDAGNESGALRMPGGACWNHAQIDTPSGNLTRRANDVPVA